jgi:allophanate hydrolase subunit 1
MTLVPYGPDAWLLRFADSADAAAFALARQLVAGLGRQPLAGLVEGVPAFTTLLLRFEPGRTPEESFLRPLLAGWLRDEAAAETPRRVELPVSQSPR